MRSPILAARDPARRAAAAARRFKKRLGGVDVDENRIAGACRAARRRCVFGGAAACRLPLCLEGWGKIGGYADTQSYMAQFGVEPRLLLAGDCARTGGLALAFGAATRPAALALGVFSLLAALIFHQGADYSEVIEFRKDFAIAGGLSPSLRSAPAPGRSTPWSRVVSRRRRRAVGLTPFLAERARLISRIAATTRLGALWCGQWPTPGSTVSVAPEFARNPWNGSWRRRRRRGRR